MINDFKLFTDEFVGVDNRKFTRLFGGFINDKPAMSVKQVADLLGKKVIHVNETINRNIKYFEYGVDILDLKKIVMKNDDDKKIIDFNDYNLKLLKSLGYTNVSIAKSKNIYVLSESGLLLYLKFTNGSKSLNLLKDIIEDYFKFKGENKIMQDTIEEQVKKWEDIKVLSIGKYFMVETDNERKECLLKAKEADKQLEKLYILSNKKNNTKD